MKSKKQSFQSLAEDFFLYIFIIFLKYKNRKYSYTKPLVVQFGVIFSPVTTVLIFQSAEIFIPETIDISVWRLNYLAITTAKNYSDLSLVPYTAELNRQFLNIIYVHV